MKKLKLTFTLLIMTSPALATDNIQQAADAVCNCLEEPYKIAAKVVNSLKQAQAAGDMSKLAQHQGEMMAVISASAKCFEALPEQFPKINQDEGLQKKVMDKANTQCPNPAASLFGAP